MDVRVLVTGATGFLGKAVLQRLGARGVGQGRSPARCAALNTEGLDIVQWVLPGPPPDCASLAQVDSVVHCAALSSPFGRFEDFHAANVLATQSVLDFARSRGVKRFVFISSPSIYFALADQLNVSEDMPLPLPFTPYAQTKIAAEQLVEKTAEVGSIILRPRGIYGPGDSALLPRLLKAARTRTLPRFRQGRARIDLTFVDDVVEAVLMALDARQDLNGKAFNISGGEVLPISEIVEKTCHRAGIAPRWRSMPLAPAMLAARLAETFELMRLEPREPVVTRYGLGLFAFKQSLDISRARDILGWMPQVRFADGLERVFDHGELR
ncbi:MAG: 3-beta hydroxysteroid dehydrogenase [Aestuariivita sp.]|nr:3-beta hydroxysteroid dehydrogenase [Aestuariivita sp.]